MMDIHLRVEASVQHDGLVFVFLEKHRIYCTWNSHKKAQRDEQKWSCQFVSLVSFPGEYISTASVHVSESKAPKKRYPEQIIQNVHKFHGNFLGTCVNTFSENKNSMKQFTSVFASLVS